MNDNDIPVTPEEEELFKEIQGKVSRKQEPPEEEIDPAWKFDRKELE